jgi:hypothetical protein
MVLSVLFLLAFGEDFAICDHPQYQANPSVIYAHGVYNVFWLDHRIPTSIFAARVTTGGILIDTTARFIYAGLPADDIRIAADGQQLLVVFREGC